ncbi:MAG: hypothetical protein PHF05_06065 [Candidatus Izemoplasmatales bacterium]|nr:hypothetical protein [Candidatus Izemoplasmatales bacterium]
MREYKKCIINERKYYCILRCNVLLDAIGKGIRKISSKNEYINEEDVLKKIIVIITNDGMENLSNKFSYAQIK